MKKIMKEGIRISKDAKKLAKDIERHENKEKKISKQRRDNRKMKRMGY